MRLVRLSGFAIFLLSGFAICSEGQVRLNFPRVLTPQELSTTGLAFVNTSSSSLSANFSFYGADGALLGTSALGVPAKGQIAKLASEILPNIKSSTWIQVSSSSSELQGFEIVGNFATLVDGAGPAAEATQLSLIDFSREDIIHIVNPGSQPASVQITLNAANGSVLTTQSVNLAGFQASSFRLGDLNNDDNIDLVSITSNVAISASLTAKLPGGADVGLTNAVPTASAPSELFFPYTPGGPQGASNWKTFVGIANISTASQTISITFNPDTGSPVTIQRTLAAGATLGDTVANLFSTPPNTFTAGWIRVTGAGRLAGVAAYQDSAAGSLAIVPSQSSGSSRFLFGHIASASPWYTGIALLNTTTTAANVEIYALNAAGTLLGGGSFSLAANTRRTALLSQLVPQVAADGGWVFVRTTNNVPLLGFELFGHAIVPVLANVQGFAVPAASTFAPPIGGTSTSGVTIDQLGLLDIGGNPKTQFQPLDFVTFVATVRNPSGAARNSAQLAFTVTDPRGQTLYTSSRTIALSSNVGDFVGGLFIPSNALTGGYVVTASLVTDGQLVTSAAGFDVNGGTSTPTAGQDPAIPITSAGLPEFAFRPGDSVHFLIQTANFTGQPITASINYQLTGPGAMNAGSGSLPFTMATGVSSQIVDMAIPPAAPQGLFAFRSTLMAGSFTSVKVTPITVVPKSSTESINLENVYVTDTNLVPRGSFAAGSTVRLFTSRLSTFPVTTAATVRYVVTGPNASSILDQPIAVNIPTGMTTASITLPLGPNAATGAYTFQATISYQEVNGGPKTSTLSATFTVGDTSSLKETVLALHPYVGDDNLITRSSFSPGEDIVLFRTVYSTFAAPTTGTVRYQLSANGGVIFDNLVNTTFNPGTNGSFIAIGTPASIPSGTYTFTTIASAQGQSSTSSMTFTIAGGQVPSLSPFAQPNDGKPNVTEGITIRQLPGSLPERQYTPRGRSDLDPLDDRVPR
jgi:hypothetical protein